MEEKIKQLSILLMKIKIENPDMRLMVIISDNEGQFKTVIGKQIDLAADLAYAIHDIPTLKRTLMMALDAYENVPVLNPTIKLPKA